MKLAMFSYNAFIEAINNGWKKGKSHEVLLIQDPQGKKWGTTQSGLRQAEYAAETQGHIDDNWQELVSEITNLDLLIIYLGSNGSERAIELARRNKIPATKLIFVMCTCYLDRKEYILERCGYEAARKIGCECGGHETMRKLYLKYLEE